MTARFRASRIPPARVREIPNGVDLRRFRPASSAEEVRALRVRLGLPTTAPIIVSVGFFSRDKAPHILFEAWRRLRHPEAVKPLVMLAVATVALAGNLVSLTALKRSGGGLNVRAAYLEVLADTLGAPV